MLLHVFALSHNRTGSENKYRKTSLMKEHIDLCTDE